MEKDTAGCVVHSGRAILHRCPISSVCTSAGLKPLKRVWVDQLGRNRMMSPPPPHCCSRDDQEDDQRRDHEGGYYNAPTAGAHGSSCTNFRGPDKVGSIKVTITWTTTGGPIAPTVITYTNNVGTATGPLNGFDTITLKAPTAVKTGSFAAGVPRTTKIITTLPAPGTHCVGTTTAFKITGGGVSV